MARTKKATTNELDINTITQSKEGAFLLMFLLTGNQKESYIFASKGEAITTNENSLKSMANAFRNKATTKQIEPMITEMFEKRAKQYLTNKGYSVQEYSEVIRDAVQCEGKDEEVITDEKVFEGLDLSNKDELLKELNKRYNGTFDDKIKNDIAKMIIDVNNMKKAEIQEDKQLKHYYLPLRKCSDCPNLHTIYNINNIAK